MAIMTTRALAVVVYVLLSLTQGSLLSRAKQTGSATVVWDINVPVLTIDDMAPSAAIIMRARVVSVTNRLSDDETNVMTDYAFLPIRLFKGTVSAEAQPAPPRRLVVSRVGGTMKVDNLTLTSRVSGFSQDDELVPGEEVVVFLARVPGGSTYEISGGPNGVFRISNGVVDGWTKEIRGRRKDRPEAVADFEQRVIRASSVRRQTK